MNMYMYTECIVVYIYMYFQIDNFILQERAALLRRWGELVHENKEELAKLLTSEMVNLGMNTF